MAEHRLKVANLRPLSDRAAKANATRQTPPQHSQGEVKTSNKSSSRHSKGEPILAQPEAPGKAFFCSYKLSMFLLIHFQNRQSFWRRCCCGQKQRQRSSLGSSKQNIT